MAEKFLMIDGNSIINRGFYALPLLTNKDGAYTNGVYGFLSILFKFLDQESPDYLAVAFDLPAPTFRHTMYAEYKGNRKSMPDELRPQIPLLKELLAKMNVRIVELEGYEADDILGTMAVRCEADGLLPVIVSGDRDLLQLCTDKIKVRIPKTRGGKTDVEDYFAKDVREKMGVSPVEYIEMKALMGDASDNIPGVPGIGEKTAQKIIEAYQTVEQAIAHAAEIKPKKASENLAAFKEQARLSRTLAEICKTVPLELAYETAKMPSFATDAARDMVAWLQFRTLLPRFEPKEKQAPVTKRQIDEAPPDGLLLMEETQTADVVRRLAEMDFSAFQFVFQGARLGGVSLAWPEDDGGVCSRFAPVHGSRNEGALLGALAPYFESEGQKATHDCKKAEGFTLRAGVKIQNVCFDAMLAAYILDASKGDYPPEDIARDFLGETLPPAQDPAGKGKRAAEQLSLDGAPATARYARAVAETVLKAYKPMTDSLAANGQLKLYEEIEHPLTGVLAAMEAAGIMVNKAELVAFGQRLDVQLRALTAAIYELGGEEFNLNSPAQLGVVLFEKLGLKAVKKTKTGYSTAADVLEKLKTKHPVVPLILEYRTLSKLKSTYVDGLLPQIDAATGKIHTTFAQTVASTGRLSSVSPNLQNIPVRLPLGRELRKVFVPSPGAVFLDGDYNQIELRVLAHMSGDETLINAFLSKQDIHRLTAGQVFNTPYDDVTPEQRSAAKAVNFGIVYGIGAFSLSEDLGISRKQAESYIDGYFKTYPRVKAYLDETVKTAAERGYAETIFGRRRAIPELSAGNFNLRSFGERVAMNMPIQGMAADIIKLAMIRVHARLSKEKLDARLILQVHDELLLEVNERNIDAAKAVLKEEMENCVNLRVPMEVDVHEGKSWFDAK